VLWWAQVLVCALVALVAGIFTYELAAVKPDWCVSHLSVGFTFSRG
jgi:hypothetical protein